MSWQIFKDLAVLTALKTRLFLCELWHFADPELWAQWETHCWNKDNVIKIVTAKKNPVLPSYRFLQVLLSIQTSASQVLCDVYYNSKYWFWKYPPLNIAVMAASKPSGQCWVVFSLSALNRRQLVAALCQGQNRQWSQLLSSLCLLEGEIFTVLLFLELKCFFSLSSKSEESQSQNSINYLFLAAIFLSNPVQTLRKCLLTEDLY